VTYAVRPVDLGLLALVAAFAGADLLIAVAGVTVASRADVIADRTGLREAIVGPLIAVADVTYRRANLEQAAASTTNLSFSALLIALLSLLLVATFGPDATVLGVHPASVVLVVAGVAGLRLVGRVRRERMWSPRMTPLTVRDEPADDGGRTRSSAWIYGTFALAVAALAAAGYLVTQFGIAVADRTGLDDTAVGVLLVATVTSLPELVTTVTAARRGALTILMAAALLLGLLRRERAGVARIGFESALILVLYVGAVLVML